MKLAREKSVLKLKAGDDVKPSDADFVRLQGALRGDREEIFVSPHRLLFEPTGYAGGYARSLGAQRGRRRFS
jgi:hypothetical protein